jgi:hypothetical protein
MAIDPGVLVKDCAETCAEHLGTARVEVACNDDHRLGVVGCGFDDQLVRPRLGVVVRHRQPPARGAGVSHINWSGPARNTLASPLRLRKRASTDADHH